MQWTKEAGHKIFPSQKKFPCHMFAASAAKKVGCEGILLFLFTTELRLEGRTLHEVSGPTL